MVRGRERRGEGAVQVAKDMTEALKRTVASLENLESELPNILSLSNPYTLSQMPPLQRAHSLLTLANITTTLFSLKLRCKGTNPDYHPVKSELDRLKVHQRKLEPFGDVGEAGLLPSSFLNEQASVDRSLPDLSSAQRKETANVSIGEVPTTINYQEQAGQKRKHPSSEEHSVQIDAEVVVKKEPVEVFGHNNGKVKDPVVIDISDDDE
ncbi:hypothetical protein PIB30_013202 [Stylosanthes scabra]|uniref:Nuclear nucleic acid-binding protein C1D n=1 Tax=Stylosanthes scabra TaxID=79078 RepID=A0ABU6Z6R4_9FABA|nr:hypothetical protein [Stylosanthes scabra]